MTSRAATRGLDRSAALVFDANGTTFLDQDAPGHRTGHDVQVRARHGRPQVGVRRRPAHAVLDRHVHRAEALLHVAVRIVGLAVACLVAGLDEGAVERVLHVVAAGDVQRTVAAAIFVAAGGEGLRLAEVGQAVAIAPAAGAERLPLVEVVRMAAHVDEAVDRGRAAQDLAARAVDGAAVEARLRRGVVAPVVLGSVHRDRERRGHLDEDAAVAAAELEDQHFGPRVLGQARGQHAARPSRRRR